MRPLAYARAQRVYRLWVLIPAPASVRASFRGTADLPQLRNPINLPTACGGTHSCSESLGTRPPTCEPRGCTILPLTGAPYVSSLLALRHRHSLDPFWLQQHSDHSGPTGQRHRVVYPDERTPSRGAIAQRHAGGPCLETWNRVDLSVRGSSGRQHLSLVRGPRGSHRRGAPLCAQVRRPRDFLQKVRSCNQPRDR